jgi:hypothetical protein
MDVFALQAEVISAREAAALQKPATLATETSAWEAATAWGSTALHVRDVQDWATLVEREALERVSRAEAENATMLASAHQDAEGFAWKVAVLKDELAAEHQAREVSEREFQEQFEELTSCRPRVPSCVMPSLIPRGRGITCLRGCGLRPSAIPKWLESLSHFGWR